MIEMMMTAGGFGSPARMPACMPVENLSKNKAGRTARNRALIGLTR